LPIIIKTKHSLKGEKRVQDGRTQVLVNGVRIILQRGWLAKGTRTNQILEPLIAKSKSNKEKGKTLKK
jgi:hypothetical protein